MFPYLSIYLQDILGYSPLATGLRFLPLTAFVFFVPLATRRFAARVPLRVMIGVGLALVAAGLALMDGLDADSGWTALLAGFIVGGIGIGIANPALAAGALSRRRSGAHRDGVGDQQHLPPRRRGGRGRGARRSAREPGPGELSAAVAPTPTPSAPRSARPGSARSRGSPNLVEPCKTAFVGGLNDVLCHRRRRCSWSARSAAALLLRSPAPTSAPATENA